MDNVAYYYTYMYLNIDFTPRWYTWITPLSGLTQCAFWDIHQGFKLQTTYKTLLKGYIHNHKCKALTRFINVIINLTCTWNHRCLLNATNILEDINHLIFQVTTFRKLLHSIDHFSSLIYKRPRQWVHWLGLMNVVS